ncbi:MAG: threonine/serine exporter family protein [Candidatus Ancillula sp.]|jgi:uncharacterized membrane protein YjjP (DUF1212 family)|nr:threonine/serine exporter family protein [Candidatus Ancillula sp.]
MREEKYEVLHEKSEVVLRAGRLALSAGLGSFRVRQIMQTVANALGIKNTSLVTLTEITSTCHSGTQCITEVASNASIGVDANRISLISEMIYDLRKKLITHEVHCINERLDVIERSKRLYNSLTFGLWAGLACFSFTILLGGDYLEGLGALLGAFAGQYFRAALFKRLYNQFVANGLSVILAGFIYASFYTVLNELSLWQHPGSAGYVGALLYVIPGFPLVTGGLDFAKLDFSSGISRTIYSWVIIFLATVVAWVCAKTIGYTPADLKSPYDGNITIWLILVFCLSFTGVLGFALMFNSPIRVAFTAASIGAVCNTFRFALLDVGVLGFVAAVYASFLVGLIASLVCHYFRFARITISVPAITIMVPGSLIFHGFFDLGEDNLGSAAHYIVKAVLVIFALPIGLAAARFLTDKYWRVDKQVISNRPV